MSDVIDTLTEIGKRLDDIIHFYNRYYKDPDWKTVPYSVRAKIIIDLYPKITSDPVIDALAIADTDHCFDIILGVYKVARSCVIHGLSKKESDEKLNAYIAENTHVFRCLEC
jgi:hypothetical protein